VELIGCRDQSRMPLDAFYRCRISDAGSSGAVAACYVEGWARSIDEAVEMIVICMEKSEGWKS